MSGSPWADPATPTEPGPPYGGPPPTTQPYAAPPAYGYPAPYGAPAPNGYPAPYWGPPGPWAVPPRRPQRPGQLITAAVLAFAQAVIVLFASLYLWFFASIADAAVAEAGAPYSPTVVNALADEGMTLAVVQLVSAVALIAAGIWALNARRRAAWVLLLVSLGTQVVLAVYWASRLDSLLGAADTGGTVAAFSLFFAAGPLVGLCLLLVGPGRRWFGGTSPA